MKKLTAIVLLFSAFVFSGCLDTVEELTIAKDGSGTYKTTMDMSGMFDMIEMMAAMDTSANSQLKKLSDKDIDSTFNLSSVMDTAAGVTEDQRQLYKGATMSLTMKQKDKVFKMAMNYPFKKLEDVQKIIELNASGKGVDIFNKGEKKQEIPPGMEDKGSMPSINNFFDITYKKGLIERRLNETKLEDLKKDEKYSQMKSAGDMLGSITYTSILHLPKPATKVEGAMVKLSDDKKTVTIKSTLADLFDNPKSLGFRIEY
jgi:hypothetical protein